MDGKPRDRERDAPLGVSRFKRSVDGERGGGRGDGKQEEEEGEGMGGQHQVNEIAAGVVVP